MATDPKPKAFHDLWTSRHLDLVGSRFEDVVITPAHTDSTTSDCPEKLAQSFNCEVKREALLKILVGEDRTFPKYSKGTSLWFEGRDVHRPCYLKFHPRKELFDHDHNIHPFVGYVHYSYVVRDRRRRWEPRPAPKGKNSPGWQLCRKRVAQATPKDWTEDPYFMCHLLALAQYQEDEVNLDFSTPTTYTSRLLVTHVQEVDYILLYEANIPTELLDGLHNPRETTTPMKWPNIRREKIPYQPYDTFSSRLTAKLAGSDLSSHSPLTSLDGVSIVTNRTRKRSHGEESSGISKIPRLSD